MVGHGGEGHGEGTSVPWGELGAMAACGQHEAEADADAEADAKADAEAKAKAEAEAEAEAGAALVLVLLAPVLAPTGKTLGPAR